MVSLQRFVDAQASIYCSVLRELQACRKSTHWMWFVFPQLKGLGRSESARFYGLDDRQEAEAYLRHEVLGPRLVECTKAVLACRGSALEIFGTPDDLKFRSSMILFEHVADDEPGFGFALDQFFEGRRDEATTGLLRIR